MKRRSSSFLARRGRSTRVPERGIGRQYGAPLALVADDPSQIAARYWDAGFTVHVVDDADPNGSIIVTNSAGAVVALVRRARYVGEDTK